MIQGAQAFNVSEFWLLVAGMWVCVYVCLRPYRLDALRDDLFEIRHRLFMYAASGAIPFDHPAYGRVRQNINCLIRFAEKLTVSRAALLWMLVPTHAQEPTRPVGELEGLSAAVRRRLDEFEQEAGNRVSTYAVNGSPFVLVFHAIRIVSRASDLVSKAGDLAIKAAKVDERMRFRIVQRLEAQVREECS